MARLVDPRGHRFGAGLSVVIGTRYSILGRPWPAARRILRLGAF